MSCPPLGLFGYCWPYRQANWSNAGRGHFSGDGRRRRVYGWHSPKSTHTILRIMRGSPTNSTAPLMRNMTPPSSPWLDFGARWSWMRTEDEQLMAKAHRFAWTGVDIETGLGFEQVANLAQRAAQESTGDLMHGKHRIASVRSSERQIEFRINDYPDHLQEVPGIPPGFREPRRPHLGVEPYRVVRHHAADRGGLHTGRIQDDDRPSHLHAVRAKSGRAGACSRPECPGDASGTGLPARLRSDSARPSADAAGESGSDACPSRRRPPAPRSGPPLRPPHPPPTTRVPASNAPRRAPLGQPAGPPAWSRASPGCRRVSLPAAGSSHPASATLRFRGRADVRRGRQPLPYPDGPAERRRRCPGSFGSRTARSVHLPERWCWVATRSCPQALQAHW